jgi:hypothetical protein
MRFSQVCAHGGELTRPHGALRTSPIPTRRVHRVDVRRASRGPSADTEPRLPYGHRRLRRHGRHTAWTRRGTGRQARTARRRRTRGEIAGPGGFSNLPGRTDARGERGGGFPQPTGPVQRADPRTSHGNRPARDRHRRMSRRTTTHPEHGRAHCHPTISAHDFGRLPCTACRLARDGRTYARSHTRTVTETYNRAEPREPPSRPLHGHESRHPSQRPLTVGMRRTTLSPQCVPRRTGTGRHPASLARAGGASPPVGSGR